MNYHKANAGTARDMPYFGPSMFRWARKTLNESLRDFFVDLLSWWFVRIRTRARTREKLSKYYKKLNLCYPVQAVRAAAEPTRPLRRLN
jgi:hypothetical protein